jgi:hypothetical protein
MKPVKIPRGAIEALGEIKPKWDERMPTWFFSKYFCAYTGEAPDRSWETISKDMADGFDQLMKAPRSEPWKEDEFMTLPSEPGKPAIDCLPCAGTGEIQCNLGEIHECVDCDGCGNVDYQPRETGRRVFRLGDRVKHLDYDLAALLDGLTVVELTDLRLKDQLPDERPFAGIDADGDIVALVQGMRI